MTDYTGLLFLAVLGLGFVILTGVVEYAADRNDRLNDWLDRLAERIAR